MVYNLINNFLNRKNLNIKKTNNKLKVQIIRIKFVQLNKTNKK